MQSIKLYQIDAFTRQAFHGNPAAVCPLDSWLSDDLLKTIAAENNLSETAFLVPRNNDYELRWFTPKSEVELCGHATLSAAFVVFNFLDPGRSAVTFHSRKYRLGVSRQEDGLVLDFPRMAYQELQMDDCPQPLTHPALRGVYEGNGTLVLRLDTEQAVRNFKPDLAFLKRERIFLSVTGPSPKPDVDFVSRYFAPSVGIDEDPVTGSAHCLLGPIWGRILGKSQLKAVQVSQREGSLGLLLSDDRVAIFGHAVCVIIGEIYPKGIQNGGNN